MSATVTLQNDRVISYRLYEKETSAVIYYVLNLDRYSLSIGGETSAFYKWVETPKSESFIRLMLRCDKYYLCNKLFKKTFDLQESIEKVKSYIKERELFDLDYEKEDYDNCIEEVDNIFVDCPSCFVQRVSEIMESYDRDHYDLPEDIWDEVQYVYGHWDERAIDLFCEYIKPELEKQLLAEEEGN